MEKVIFNYLILHYTQYGPYKERSLHQFLATKDYWGEQVTKNWSKDRYL